MTDAAIKELFATPELMSLPHLAILHYLVSKTGTGIRLTVLDFGFSGHW
jgi:hypothetical protein